MELLRQMEVTLDLLFKPIRLFFFSTLSTFLESEI